MNKDKLPTGIKYGGWTIDLPDPNTQKTGYMLTFVDKDTGEIVTYSIIRTGKTTKEWLDKYGQTPNGHKTKGRE